MCLLSYARVHVLVVLSAESGFSESGSVWCINNEIIVISLKINNLINEIESPCCRVSEMSLGARSLSRAC